MTSPEDTATATAPAPSTPPRVSEEATSLKSLRLVSFNVAGCVPSKEAPPNWDTTVAAEAMAEEVLRSDPDILALQEFPSGDPAKLAQVFPAYQVMGRTPSHADYVVLLIKKGISAKFVSTERGEIRIPGVLAELTWKDDRHLLVASVHLAPFLTGADTRQIQVEALLRQAKKLDMPILIAGDTNMRASEDGVMEGYNNLGLLDAWKEGGAQPETKFTWDTVDHTTADGGGSFNRYYGQTTREYTARYDRIYLSQHNKTLLSVVVDSFELIANKPLTNRNHFLSDHFGIATELSFNWIE